MHRKQLTVFIILLLVYASCAFVTYAFFTGELAATAGMPMPDLGVENSVLGLANAGIVLVLYGILGMAGYWFARRLDLPGIFSEEGNWRRWFFLPLLLGLCIGVYATSLDLLFAPLNGFGRLVHPGFPLSIFASLGAGIGEEILCRSFIFGLWGLVLSWLLKRFHARTVALWMANVIAALVFGASHLGTIMILTHASSPAGLSPFMWLEMFLLNGVLGLVAGWRYMKDGLVAAAGVHFWADVVFHVLYGLF